MSGHAGSPRTRLVPEVADPPELKEEKGLAELENWLGAILSDRKRLSGT